MRTPARASTRTRSSSLRFRATSRATATRWRRGSRRSVPGSPPACSWLPGHRGELGRHALEDLGPVTRVTLAEQPHRGVPRTVFTPGEPAPVRHGLQDHPHTSPECTCEVRECRVRRDDKVEPYHYRRRLIGDLVRPHVRGIGQLCNAAREIDRGSLFGAGALLERHETDTL